MQVNFKTRYQQDIEALGKALQNDIATEVKESLGIIEGIQSRDQADETDRDEQEKLFVAGIRALVPDEELIALHQTRVNVLEKLAELLDNLDKFFQLDAPAQGDSGWNDAYYCASFAARILMRSYDNDYGLARSLDSDLKTKLDALSHPLNNFARDLRYQQLEQGSYDIDLRILNEMNLLHNADSKSDTKIDFQAAAEAEPELEKTISEYLAIEKRKCDLSVKQDTKMELKKEGDKVKVQFDLADKEDQPATVMLEINLEAIHEAAQQVSHELYDIYDPELTIRRGLKSLLANLDTYIKTSPLRYQSLAEVPDFSIKIEQDYIL